MSKRYQKDLRVVGKPIIDNETLSILSTDALVNILNEQDQQIKEMKQLLEDMANNAVFKRLSEITSNLAIMPAQKN